MGAVLFALLCHSALEPPTLLHFGASWCAPCIAELPWIAEVDARYRTRGLKTVVVSLDAAFEKSAKEHSLTATFDRDGSLADRYQVKDLPHVVAIDASGAIAISEAGLKASSRREVEAWLLRTFPGSPEDREEEVTFEEEVDRESLKTLAPLPEYRTSAWLVALPIGCALLIAWNVDWRNRGRRHRRTKERR